MLSFSPDVRQANVRMLDSKIKKRGVVILAGSENSISFTNLNDSRFICKEEQ